MFVLFVPSCGKRRGWVLVHRTELVTVQIFFLNEPDRHHAILFQPAVKFAAVDSERGRGSHLISAKLLQDGKDVTLLDLGQRDRVVHVSLKYLPEVLSTRLRLRDQ